MNALKRAIIRLVRILLAYVIVLVVKYIAEFYSDFSIPSYIVPVVSAILNAIAKFFREKWGIDVKV